MIVLDTAIGLTINVMENKLENKWQLKIWKIRLRMNEGEEVILGDKKINPMDYPGWFY